MNLAVHVSAVTSNTVKGVAEGATLRSAGAAEGATYPGTINPPSAQFRFPRGMPFSGFTQAVTCEHSALPLHQASTQYLRSCGQCTEQQKTENLYSLENLVESIFSYHEL